MKENRINNVRLYVRVTQKEAQIIKRKSKNCLSLNDYIRKVALNGTVILPAQSIDRETLIELVRIGNNINQIARSLNQTGYNIFNRGIRQKLIEDVAELRLILDEKITNLDKKIYL